MNKLVKAAVVSSDWRPFQTEWRNYNSPSLSASLVLPAAFLWSFAVFMSEWLKESLQFPQSVDNDCIFIDFE